MVCLSGQLKRRVQPIAPIPANTSPWLPRFRTSTLPAIAIAIATIVSSKTAPKRKGMPKSEVNNSNLPVTICRPYSIPIDPPHQTSANGTRKIIRRGDLVVAPIVNPSELPVPGARGRTAPVNRRRREPYEIGIRERFHAAAAQCTVGRNGHIVHRNGVVTRRTHDLRQHTEPRAETHFSPQP
jgi:hypothetical protein